MTEEKEPLREPAEPGGRRQQNMEDMSSEALAVAYGDAVRLRAHELSWPVDEALGKWMGSARGLLGKRGHLGLIGEFLPVYYDPSRKSAVFGPGAALVGKGAIERAVAPSPRALKSAG